MEHYIEQRMIPIKQLKFADYNPRKITKEAFDKLVESIKAFGFTSPNTVNMAEGREYILIGGHMRTRAAEAAGLTEVPCLIVKLDIAKEKMLNVALNNRSLMGQWDEDKLAELVIGLQTEGAEVKLMGFDEGQIKAITEGIGPDGGHGLNEGHDCPRCKELREAVEGHQRKAQHFVYEPKTEQK